MSRSLRIAVADDEPGMLTYYQEVLTRLGHEVVCRARSGPELVERCRQERPDLVITDIQMPGQDGIDAAVAMCPEVGAPVILVSAFHDEALLRRAEADHIVAYMVKPIKQEDLRTMIPVAMRRFEQFQALRKEAADLRQALEDRKLVERAKGVLMKKAQIDEQEAFRRLQQMARENRRKLVDIAQMILLVEQALQPGARNS